MSQKLFLVLLAALVWYGTNQHASQKAPSKAESRCELTEDDYAVYAALMNGLGGPEDPEEAWQGKKLLIVDVTAGPSDTHSHWGGWGFRSRSKAAPSQETIADFEKKARDTCVLQSQFADTKPYNIIAKDEVDKIFKHGNWEDFYKKYPEAGGVWGFSRPGYNSARTEAVLYVSHACGMLCGTGHLFYLARQNNQWKVQNRLMLWIS